MFTSPKDASERMLLALSKKSLQAFYLGAVQLQDSQFHYLKRCILNNTFKDGIPSKEKADDGVARLALLADIQAKRQEMTIAKMMGIETNGISYRLS